MQPNSQFYLYLKKKNLCKISKLNGIGFQTGLLDKKERLGKKLCLKMIFSTFSTDLTNYER